MTFLTYRFFKDYVIVPLAGVGSLLVTMGLALNAGSDLRNHSGGPNMSIISMSVEMKNA